MICLSGSELQDLPENFEAHRRPDEKFGMLIAPASKQEGSVGMARSRLCIIPDLVTAQES
jgi:hypothetical protein